MNAAARLLNVVFLAALLNGCSTLGGWLPSAGPMTDQVTGGVAAQIPLIPVDEATARRVAAARHNGDFSALARPAARRHAYAVGPGDVLEVSVWEAPPAILFGVAAPEGRGAVSAGARAMTLPAQMVAEDGTITVPFVGPLHVAGRSPESIARLVAARLNGKAHQPQVLVRVVRNASSNVTVVGEVARSLRMPLTPKGERLLDALAAAGGVRQPVGKTTVQLSRGGKVYSMPLDAVIRQPRDNIRLRPGDVVTAVFQSNSFIALGAAGRNREVNFEAGGITLAQGLGRIGGLQDQQADVQGVFIFRFEDPAALPHHGRGLPHTPDGRYPVVYRADLRNPATFLAAQDFPLRDRDVVYVADAPGAQLQKFLNILTSSIFSVSNIIALKP